jgi:hypothetical protein
MLVVAACRVSDAFAVTKLDRLARSVVDARVPGMDDVQVPNLLDRPSDDALTLFRAVVDARRAPTVAGRSGSTSC